MDFDYREAFHRNIGLVTEEEQQILRGKTIVIPGQGGVGGCHLLSLVRQGFEKFKIADRDQFELKNFNRQAGALLHTIGQKKVDVMRELALQINPRCQIETIDDFVTERNVDSFLKGADLVIDGIDAFEVDPRRAVFNRALERGIPVISAGPVGLGSVFLIFMPGGPTFDDYFAIQDDTPPLKKIMLFLLGMAPDMLQRTYMQKVNFKEKRGPSSVGAVNLCAGIATIYAIKILLKKQPIKAVPYYHQFDVMNEQYVCKELPGGNRNPVQQQKLREIEKLMPD